jgi:hypothetical protein
MKLWKTLIRIWLTLASLISFLIGWVVLAHAPKPNQFTASNVPAAPKLDPVPSLNEVMNSSGGGQAQNFVQIRPVQRSPILRSGGS